jgi:hypothetical protein
VAAAALLSAQQPLVPVCAACHSEPATDFQTHPHFEGGVDCDACHGESKAHREATGHKPPDQVAAPREQAAVCGRCHEAAGKEYVASKHGQLVMARSEKRAAACTTCHGTHAERSRVAMETQCNRCHTELPAACKKAPPQDKLRKPVCASCHAPHSLARRP